MELIYKNILIFSSIVFLSACAAPVPQNSENDKNLSCDQLAYEISALSPQATGNADIARTVDTGASVAVQGASMAGVPYVGGVYSIGKTLFSHGQQNAAKNQAAAQERLIRLQTIAEMKNCR